MENGGIKNIVLIALVVVFSFFIGSMTVDGITNALTPIVMIAGAFMMLYLGKNSKYLIFYLPPVLGVLRVSFAQLDMTSAICVVVFAYWLLMRLMGYVRLKWTGLFLADSLVLLLALYMCLSFYRNPVAVQALGLESDIMGGADYAACLIGLVAYVGVSLIPFSYLELCTTIRCTYYLQLAVSILQVFLSLSGKFGGDSSAVSELGEAASNSRFTLFSGVGVSLFSLIYAMYPLRKLITSPGKMVLLLLCLIAVFFSGWRGAIIAFVLMFYFLAFFKRELTVFLCVGLFCYAGLLFLSSEHALENLPFGVQRSLCAIPGIHVSKKVEEDASGSSDWRKEMWGWALDPRTRYIKDYVWGDGPGLSKSQANRFQIAVMRGTENAGNNQQFARTGVWHSGWITLMHRYGIVGLVIAGMYHLSFAGLVVLVCFRYRSTKFFVYVLLYCSGALPGLIMYYLGTGVPTQLFAIMPALAIYKQLYKRVRENGLGDSFFARESYTPLMIQEIREKEEPRAMVKA